MSSESTDSEYAQLPRPGDVIEERYRLIRVIGSGGMGVIIRAEQIRTGRDVAVKVLHPHIAAKGNFAARFKREAQVATLFDHGSIVRVYDVGETDSGLLYLVMELLEGRELKDVIDSDAPLPVGRTMEMGLQLLDGLAEAHSQEVVHRDLKPANIFVARDRRSGDDVKILDFGIAKLTNSQDTQLTATGKISGTPSYIPPEVMVGEKFASHKTVDVYAAGLILLEMLTGQKVFAAETMAQTLLKQLKHPVGIPDAIAQTPLGEVIRRATAKHPEDRYSDGEVMFDALSQIRGELDNELRLEPGASLHGGVETSPSLFNQMAQQGSDTNLAMLRELPQHLSFEHGSQGASTDSAPTDGSPRSDGHQAQDEGLETPSTSDPEVAGAASASQQNTAIIAVLIAAIVVLALAAAIVFDFGGQSSTEDDPVAIEESSSVAEQYVVGDHPQRDEIVSVRLDSEPSGALVWMANQVLGQTGVTLDFDRDQLPQKIRLEKENYHTETIEIAAAEDMELNISLDPVDEDEREPREESIPDDMEVLEADDPVLPTVRDQDEPMEREEVDRTEPADDPVARYLRRGGDDDEEESAHEEPAHEESAHEEPAHEESAHEEPAQEESAHEESAHEEPAHEEPAHEEPVIDEETDEEIEEDPNDLIRRHL